MIWYIVICGLLEGHTYDCSRGLSFESEEVCGVHRDAMLDEGFIYDAYCAQEADDIKEYNYEPASGAMGCN